MPRLPIIKEIYHYKFIKINKINEFVSRLIEGGWIPEDDGKLDGKEFRKKSWRVITYKHENYNNYGFTFKHDCNLGFRDISDEEYKIEKEQESGMYRINIKKRNTENNRTATFIRSIRPLFVMDGGYDEGTYDDNGEKAICSHAWNRGIWINLN